MSWKTTAPPKRKQNPIILRFQQDDHPPQEAPFVWSDMENTWVEASDDPDGVALYPDDGWKVLGWKE